MEQNTPRRGLAQGALKPSAVLGIAVAAISPTTSVFLVYGDGYSLAGNGVIWAFFIGALIAASMAFCYAEVGSVFPSAGGAYTIIRRALGPIWGGLAACLFLVLGITATASILVSAATFLNELLPCHLPTNWVALGLMALVTFLSLERIGPTGWVTTAMLILELAVILVFTIVAFFHMTSTHGSVTHPVLHSGHGTLKDVGFATLLAAVVPALFAFNGYDWPLYFAEESGNDRRMLPRAVLLAAGISIVVEVAAVIAATLAIKSPEALAKSDSPLVAISHDVLGGTGTKFLLAGVVIAMFDTGLAGNLGYARIFYAVARDRLWPPPLNSFFGEISEKRQVPRNGILVLFAGNAILCISTQLQNLITFTGVIIVTIYVLVAVSALLCRMRDKQERPFRMPLWPLWPCLGLAGCVAALSQQSERDLVITGIVILIALVAYLAVRNRLPKRLESAQSDTGSAADG